MYGNAKTHCNVVPIFPTIHKVINGANESEEPIESDVTKRVRYNLFLEF